MLNITSLNQRLTTLQAEINTLNPPVGGSVNNPMTTNLDAGAFNISNIADATGVNGSFTSTLTSSFVNGAVITATNKMDTPNINDTSPPQYVSYGAVTAPTEYILGAIQPKSGAEGCVSGVLRALQSGFKQTIYFNVIGFENKGTILILSNVAESDTPIFGSLQYGEDVADPTRNLLTFITATPTTKVECVLFQNQADLGALAPYGSPFTFPIGTGQVGAIYAQTDLTLNTLEHTGTIKSQVKVEAPSANIDQLTDLGGGGITLQGTDLIASGNNIKLANNVETSVIKTPFAGGSLNLGSDFNTQGFIMRSLAVAPDDVIKMESNLEMLNGDILNVDEIDINAINKTTPGGNIIINAPIDMNSNKITGASAPTANSDVANKLYVDTTASASGVQNPMIVDLDAGSFNITSVGTLTNNGTSGVINSNGNFFHNYQTGANLFTAGGDIITFNPETELKITSTNQGATLVDYQQSNRTLTINDSATLDCIAGSVLSTQVGSTNTFAGAVNFTGNDIEGVGKVNALAGANTGMTTTAGGNIEMTTDANAVILTNTRLEVQEGNINQTTINAQGAGTAGGIVVTNGVRGRFFDGGLSIYNPAPNEIMDGRNHDFLEGYGTQFASTEFPRQTDNARGSFGVRVRCVINPTANQFISFRIIPQASQSIVSPEITYSRLCFQGNGNAPTGWENDNTTIAPNVVVCPALQVNRFLEGSELYLQARCVYASSNYLAGNFAPLTYIVSYSGVESDSNPVSGEVVCKWTAPIVGVTKFSFEVLAESVGGITEVRDTEFFCDGMVQGSLL